MTLPRPRYSLLSLLICMGLVGVGAKLWHGPHISDSPSTTFYYCRGFKTLDKIPHGPWVKRTSYENTDSESVMFTYYRDGNLTSRVVWLMGAKNIETLQDPFLTACFNPKVNPEILSEYEESQLQKAVQQESTRLKMLYPQAKIIIEQGNPAHSPEKIRRILENLAKELAP